MGIPAGFSQVILKMRIDSPGGFRIATTSLGVVGAPSTIMATDIGQAWQTDVWNVLGSTNLDYVSCEVRDSANADEVFFNTNGPIGLEIIAPNTCVLVQRRSSLIGKKNRGRMYVPGIAYDATFNQAGQMSSGSVTDYTAAFTDFFSDLVGLGYDPVILHADGSTPTAQTSFSVDSTAATQRRRLRP